MICEHSLDPDYVCLECLDADFQMLAKDMNKIKQGFAAIQKDRQKNANRPHTRANRRYDE